LKISSHLDEFTLQGTFMAYSLRDDIYLFLSPTVVGASGGQLAVHLPPANKTHYWSFDLEGLNHLPQDIVDDFALPRVSFSATLLGRQWSQEVYDTISDFHRAKGFDPISQDVALELGYPLVDVDRLNSLIKGDKVSFLILAISRPEN
jgi:hypothetical protein